MKKSLLYMAGLIVASAGFTACDDDFTQPPMEEYIPHATIQPNTTVAELKEAFNQNAIAYSVQIGTKADGSDYVVKGRVVSSDQTSNMYKKICIEDETGALIFSVNANKMYETWKFGQEIVVNVTGMYYGNYSGGNLVGGFAAAAEGPSRMAKTIWEAGVQIDGLVNTALVDTTLTTIPDIDAIRSNPTEYLVWQGKLVRFDNMHFENPGQELGSSSSFNNTRYLIDGNGRRLALNTCGYGTLWNIVAPMGEGSVVGILSNYTNPGSGAAVWQLNLLDAESLIGFTPFEIKEVDPVGSFNVGFDSGSLPEGWTEDAVKGTKKWYVTDFNGNYYAAMTGYKGTAPFDSWLVSQPIDASLMTAKTLEFQTQVNGYGSTTTAIEVYIMTDADPSKATLTKLDAAWAEAPASGYSSWKDSGVISLAAAKGKFYIGWRYTATTDANYATWCVDNIVVK